MSWEASESQGRPLKLWLEREAAQLAGPVASERGEYKESELRPTRSQDLLSPVQGKPRPGQVKIKE